MNIHHHTIDPDWLLGRLPDELKHEIGKFAHLMQMREIIPDGDLESVGCRLTHIPNVTKKLGITEDVAYKTAAFWLTTLLDFGVRTAITETDTFRAFYLAALVDDIPLIRRLVRLGYNINARYYRLSHLDTVLSELAIISGQSPEHHKHLSTLRVFCQEGARVNPGSESVHDTHVLHRLIIHGCNTDNVVEALKILLKHGASLSRALHAVGRYPSQVPIIKLLLDAGADIEERWQDNTPLTYAANKKIPDIVQAFIDAGASVNGAGEDHPLFAAIRPADGYYSLPSTAATLKILCDAGADTKVIDDHRHSILSYALTTGYRENGFEPDETVPFVIDTLCKGGADVNFRHRTVKYCSGARRRDTPLHFAARTPEEFGPNTTPPEVPAECMEILISYGANVDSKNRAGLTPLHEAVKESNLLCARVLVKHGASMDLKDIHGQTALMLAQSMDPRSEEMVAFLMEQESRANVS